MLAVLGVAAAERVVVAIAYRPALLFVDSWGYVDVAYRDSPVGFAPERPSGYPLILHLLAVPGRSLLAITTVQHLAGLALGVLVYLLLLRLDVPKVAAAIAVAVVVFDGRAVALEQHVLTEALFTLVLFASLVLAIGRGRRGPGALAASGALLALAITMRSVALFAVPAWIAYVVWAHRRPVPLAAAALALALPLVGYAALHAGGDRTRLPGTGQFALSEMDGWFLYAKVAPVADCRGAGVPAAVASLCEPASLRRDDADFYLWSPESPARQLFRGGRDKAEQVRDNRLLRRFALAVIRHHPWPYAREVGRDFLRFFRPGGGGTDVTVSLPAGGPAPRPCGDCDGVATEPVDSGVRDRWYPGYEPRVHAPAGIARAWHRVTRVPRWLIGLLALVALASLALAISPRFRPSLRHRAEMALLLGAALLMLLGDAATTKFWIRYLVPVVPLLTCAGAVGATGLIRAIRSARAARTRFPVAAAH